MMKEGKGWKKKKRRRMKMKKMKKKKKKEMGMGKRNGCFEGIEVGMMIVKEGGMV
jgi:hypothetical protein